MDLLSRFVINGPNVIHDTIDGEAVIINLMSGRYYSLQHTGAEIWDLIENGATAADVARAMTQRYDAGDVDMEHVVVQFLGKLQEENLIRVDGSDEPGPDSVVDTPATTGSPREAASFAAPVLSVYSDLEDILLLDPIHEVDEEGWPVATPAPSP